jgi:uncharacterized protein YfaT (DUF1175 family)
MRRAFIGGCAVLAAAAGIALRPGREPEAPSPPPESTGSRGTALAEPPAPLLLDPADRETFRGWFTFLAEAMFHRPAGSLPPEIADCAALLRFAYRESLRPHDGHWAGLWALDHVPPLGSIRGPSRKSAVFQVDDAGTLAEFADARTLMRFNARQVGNDIHQARPGDLLFYYVPGQDSPFHVMIYLGASRIEPEPGPYVVYHTGPIDGKQGEMRRPSVAELLRHPEPRWRPVAGNSHFVGVFRWKLLA